MHRLVPGVVDPVIRDAEVGALDADKASKGVGFTLSNHVGKHMHGW